MLHKPLAPIEDDTEDAPWMVMGMAQWSAAVAFYQALHRELRSRNKPVLVAAMLPVRFQPPGGERIETLAPDVLVARVPEYLRNSYDVEREGVPPAFVLEVMSPYSIRRDTEEKLDRYDRMGVGEYALYSPEMPDGRRLIEPALQGYRRDPVTGGFERWRRDEHGRLYSDVLDLWLTVRGGDLRAQRPDGTLVPTTDEIEQQQREVEAELARLRAELEKRRQ